MGRIRKRNIFLIAFFDQTEGFFQLGTVECFGNFGLSKCVRDEVFAVYDDPNKIPFKWLPPEVLSQRELTAKTDIWSFGMVCHEMYFIGEPYGILPAGKVYHFLGDGYRFEKQRNMPHFLYEITLECWRKQPVDRPTISTVRRRLNNYMIDDEC